MEAQKKRVSIVNEIRAEMSPVEILTVFKYKKDTVYRLKKYDDFIAVGGSADQFFTVRISQEAKRQQGHHPEGHHEGDGGQRPQQVQTEEV